MAGTVGQRTEGMIKAGRAEVAVVVLVKEVVVGLRGACHLGVSSGTSRAAVSTVVPASVTVVPVVATARLALARCASASCARSLWLASASGASFLATAAFLLRRCHRGGPVVLGADSRYFWTISAICALTAWMALGNKALVHGHGMTLVVSSVELLLRRVFN